MKAVYDEVPAPGGDGSFDAPVYRSSQLAQAWGYCKADSFRKLDWFHAAVARQLGGETIRSFVAMHLGETERAIAQCASRLCSDRWPEARQLAKNTLPGSSCSLILPGYERRYLAGKEWRERPRETERHVVFVEVGDQTADHYVARQLGVTSMPPTLRAG